MGALLGAAMLGLLTTIAATWGLAWSVDPQGRTARARQTVHHDDVGARWRLERYENEGLVRCAWYVEPGSAPGRRAALEASIDPLIPAWSVAPRRDRARLEPMLHGDGMGVIIEDGVGWPLPALRSRAMMLASGAFACDGTGLVVARRGGTAPLISRLRVLPLEPILPGLAIDAAIASLLWLIPIVAIPEERRARRRRAGRCVACGFDRRGDPAGPCPECGKG